MFLQYGVSSDGQLVYINQVPRGQTGLHCPYCNGLLLAKKGAIKEYHFAHAGETCRQVSRDPNAIALPAFDKFDLSLRAKDYSALQYIRNTGFAPNGYTGVWLEEKGLAQFNRYSRGGKGQWELTNIGKIPFGDLSLSLFNDYQEARFAERHTEIEQAAQLAYSQHRADFDTLLTDLKLYRAQWRRVLSTSLYFLHIQSPSLPDLYKIGVTTRAIRDRVAEVKGDLLPLIGQVDITVLETWDHRGNVELYFKHRYSPQQHPLAPFTEYFIFPDVKPILRDLRRMKPKEFTPLEREVLDGLPTAIERQIAEENTLRITLEKRRARRQAIAQGMQVAREQGKHVGRPAGKETDEEFFSKPSIAAVIRALDAGLSQRQAAKEAGVSLNTVIRVVQRRKQAQG